MVELTTVTILVKTINAFFLCMACQSICFDGRDESTTRLRPVIWVLRVVGLECYEAPVIVAGRYRPAVMLGNIVVCFFLAVPRSRILVANLTDESLQAAFTSLDVLLILKFS